jgi:hypothetical protein
MKKTRLEQRKDSVEKTLKDFNIPYISLCDRRFFKITYQGQKLLLDISNKYIDIRNRKDTKSYGFFTGVTDFRYFIENGYSLKD